MLPKYITSRFHLQLLLMQKIQFWRCFSRGFSYIQFHCFRNISETCIWNASFVCISFCTNTKLFILLLFQPYFSSYHNHALALGPGIGFFGKKTVENACGLLSRSHDDQFKTRLFVTRRRSSPPQLHVYWRVGLSSLISPTKCGIWRKDHSLSLASPPTWRRSRWIRRYWVRLTSSFDNMCSYWPLCLSWPRRRPRRELGRMVLGLAVRLRFST